MIRWREMGLRWPVGLSGLAGLAGLAGLTGLTGCSDPEAGESSLEEVGFSADSSAGGTGANQVVGSAGAVASTSDATTLPMETTDSTAGGATSTEGLLGMAGAGVDATGPAVTGLGGTSSGGAESLGGVAAMAGSAAISAVGGGAAQAGGGANSLGGAGNAGAPVSDQMGGADSMGAAGGADSMGGASMGGASMASAGSPSMGGSMAQGGAGSGGDAPTSDSELCPPGITQTISVAKSGAQFTSVQAAVDSIASGSTEPTRINIAAGTYREKITIASRRNLCLVGEDTATTILTYDDNNAKVGSTSGSFSVHVSADDFSAANLTIENSFGSGSQAVALRTTGDRQQFSNCRFVGYQDTLYTHNGSQYFRDCYVQGNTDYVFGGATAILQNCEVRNVESGSAVAAPNTDASAPFGIVFLGGRFTAVDSLGANRVALGRPWGQQGAAAYLNVELGAHIASAGFVEMSGNNPLNARFREYQSTGPGANPNAHSTYQMSANEAADFTVSNVFGGWIPSYSQ